MRTTPILALTLLVSAVCGTGAAIADESLYLTPPLFREQAREIQQVRRASELTTTPQPVSSSRPAAPRSVQRVADAETTSAR